MVVCASTSPGSLLRGRYRWYVIAALLATITAINYVDRQTLAVLIAEVKKDITIDEIQYGRMTSAFLVAYALMYAGGGWIVDKIGVRFGYMLIAGSWSIACASHSLVGSAAGLIAARFVLGFTEGGGFPASAKAVAEWFPPKERSFAIGIFNTGSALGSTIAPPLLAAITVMSDWRMAFIAAGAVGLVWTSFWTWIYRPARECFRVSEEERNYVLGAGAGSGSERPAGEGWTSLLCVKELWILITARFLTGGPWFFLIFWFPKYLGDVWHFDTKEVGWYGWLPYAFAGVGSFSGGWFSSWLMHRGMGLNRARKLSLGLSAGLLPAAIVIALSPRFTSTPYISIAFACVAFLGHQFWSVIMHTLTPDLFPSRLVGSAAGLIGMAEAGGAALFAEIIGRVLQFTERDYTIPFLITGILHPIAFGLIALTIRKIAPLKRFQTALTAAPSAP